MIDHVQVYKPLNGQSYATAPTPRNSDNSINLSDNSNKIATTEWINSKKFIQTINTKEPDSNGNVNIPSRNVGDEWFSYTGKIPAGGVPYCGQIVTREAYSDLWNYVQTNNLVKTELEWQELNTNRNGNVPFYSDGDGSSTFRMPKVVGYIKGTSNIDSVGSYIEEGLPNITGHVHGISEELKQNGEANPSWIGGAFAMNWQNGYSYTNSNASTVGGFDFNASLSNPIYGNSTHVTPETTNILFGVYAYAELTVTGSTTTDKLSTGLASLETRVENGFLPVGSVVALASNSTPLGYLICNGAEVSRTTYVNLYEKIGDTYGAGDGTTTFNLPYLIDRFIQGSDTVGTVMSAGLPDAYGVFNPTGLKSVADTYGVFAVEENTVADYNEGIRSGYGARIDMRLSRSNPIYGTSTTVQPPALTMRYYIKY